MDVRESLLICRRVKVWGSWPESWPTQKRSFVVEIRPLYSSSCLEAPVQVGPTQENRGAVSFLVTLWLLMSGRHDGPFPRATFT